MEKKFFEDFADEITKIRLSVYKADGDDDATATAKYLYNIKLCNSLYPCLNMFEIALRNSIDKALQNFTGTSDWFGNIKLTQEGLQKISSAKKKIQNCSKIVTHDRVISELTLGFWTSLFSKPYAQEKFHPYIIKTCFKNAPKAEKSAIPLWTNLDAIRILRNRIFHYERIINDPNLKALHEKILEFTKWLAPKSYEILLKIDKFEEVHNTGLEPTENFVNENFNPASVEEKEETEKTEEK